MTDRIRSLLLLSGGIAAFILVPYLFWQQVWFGGELSEAELGQAFASPGRSRPVQHALEQIVGRISRGDASVRRWYPSVVSEASSPHPEVRIAAAWAMGHDTGSRAFHEALLRLVRDPEPLVRRNAALALAGFRDPAGLPVLRTMLEPQVVESPAAGTATCLVEAEEPVRRGTPLARINQSGERHDVVSRLPGPVKALLVAPGTPVSKGDPLLILSPDPQHVWEALRALLLVGTAREEDRIRSVLADPAYPEIIKQQAVMTLRTIQQRSRQRAQ